MTAATSAKMSLADARRLVDLYEAGFKAPRGVGESAVDHVAKTLGVTRGRALSMVTDAKRMLERVEPIGRV